MGYKNANLGVEGCGHSQIELLCQIASKTTEKCQRNKDTTESNGVEIGKRVLKYKKVDVQRISNRL